MVRCSSNLHWTWTYTWNSSASCPCKIDRTLQVPEIQIIRIRYRSKMGLIAKKSMLFLSLGVVALAAQKEKVAKR